MHIEEHRQPKRARSSGETEEALNTLASRARRAGGRPKPVSLQGSD